MPIHLSIPIVLSRAFLRGSLYLGVVGKYLDIVHRTRADPEGDPGGQDPSLLLPNFKNFGNISEKMRKIGKFTW